ncbi:MAG: RDD family protein [Acidobacteria bacterium]|nr:RDD family protein [Acidobacteriota bacterium]
MSKFCPYCGKQYSERSKFCPQCGKGRRNVVEAQSASAAKPVHEVVEKMNRAATAERAPAMERNGSAGTASNEAARLTTPARPAVKPTPMIPASARKYAPATHAFIGVYEQAGFGLRYGAWMFDFLITLIALMVFTFAISAIGRRSVVDSNQDLFIVAGLTLLLLILNFVVLAGLNGQSAGMRILGIQITRADGKRFTMWGAAIRHLIGYPLSMLVFFLGFLWMLWDPRQQGWHDKLAGTIVVMSR